MCRFVEPAASRRFHGVVSTDDHRTLTLIEDLPVALPD